VLAGLTPKEDEAMNRLAMPATRPAVTRPTPLRAYCRWMIRRDFPAVLDIEAASQECPWLEDDFLPVLRRRNSIGYVAEHDEQVVGFMIYELHATHLHILKFAVDPCCRHRGVGRALAAKLTGKLSNHRRTSLVVRARETHLGGLLFLRSLGFRATGSERGYFDGELSGGRADSGEDAVTMVYQLEGEDAR
jgi:ribosomal-protein-alanine N-acetyltransferase